MEDLIAKIQRELEIIANTAGVAANVPKKSGNLQQSIKLVMVSPTQYQIIIDEEQAPYAAQVEQYKPYWNRVAMYVSYRLASILGGVGKLD